MWLATQSNGWSSSTRVVGGVGSHHDSTTTMNDHQKQHHQYQANRFPLVWIGNQNWSMALRLQKFISNLFDNLGR
jgi:hypothetical protein